MSKDKRQLLSPLFLKYQAEFEKNPRSRVFAPLAETYRKLGMSDKAMEILSQGIRFHPAYVMGYLGLAFCYYDLQQYSLAYSTLRPLVETNRDNIRLQKLFADVCLELNYKEEALETYKYLLFINPRDKEVALQVVTLEKIIEEQYKPVHQPIYIPEERFSNNYEEQPQMFDVTKLETRPKSSQADFDDWMALDLSRDQKTFKSNDPYEFWNLKKGDAPVDLTIKIEPKKEEFQKEVLRPNIHVELDLDKDEETENLTADAPLVTHTLVDLYCGQGHIEKALEVLEKILSLNPNDQKTIKKISEIKALLDPYEAESHEEIKTISQPKPQLKILNETSEEDGRKTLMNIFDQKVGHVEIEEIPEASGPNLVKARMIEEKLTQFLKKIQKRALDYQARS